MFEANRPSTGTESDPQIKMRLERTRETVLITRPAAEVKLTRLGPGDGAFVEAILERAPLATAAEAALQSDETFDLSTCLATLLSMGALMDAVP